MAGYQRRKRLVERYQERYSAIMVEFKSYEKSLDSPLSITLLEKNDLLWRIFVMSAQ